MLQAQTSLDSGSVPNDNQLVGSRDDNLDNAPAEATATGDEAREQLSQDSVLHCDSINYDVLCALAGTTNLGGVRNFTMRVRWVGWVNKYFLGPRNIFLSRCPGPQDTIQRLPRLMPFITALYLDNSSFYNFR